MAQAITAAGLAFTSMEVNGLPLHALVIHGAVVFGPVAALLALVYVAVAPSRDWLRWPMVGLAVLAGLFVLAAYLSGRSYLGANPGLQQVPAVQTHEGRAGITLWITLAFSVVATAAGVLHPRPGAVRVGVRVLLTLCAVATLVSVVLTGDAGSRAVWG